MKLITTLLLACTAAFSFATTAPRLDEPKLESPELVVFSLEAPKIGEPLVIQAAPNQFVSPDGTPFGYLYMKSASNSDYQLVRFEFKTLRNVARTGQNLDLNLLAGESLNENKQKVTGLSLSWKTTENGLFLELGGMLLFREEDQPDISGFFGFGYTTKIRT